MPKRTNNFQKLVYHFKKQLASSATVTESKELLDRVTGAMVEVDVCIETKVGGDSFMISVECTKRSRKATVGWVNEMLEKHATLPTKMLVLASGSGFVRNAKIKAESKGVKLIYLNTISEGTARNIIGQLKGAMLRAVKIDVDVKGVRLSKTPTAPACNVRIINAVCVYGFDGTPLGTFDDLIKSVLDTTTCFDSPGSDHKKFKIEWLPEFKGRPLCLQKTETGELRPIERAHISGRFFHPGRKAGNAEPRA